MESSIFNAELKNELDALDWPPRLCVRLGLGHHFLGKDITLALLRYRVSDVLDARKGVTCFCAPTVLDSGFGEYKSAKKIGLVAELLHRRIDYCPEHLWRVGTVNRAAVTDAGNYWRHNSDEERTLSENGIDETKTYADFLSHILFDNISPEKQARGHGEMLAPQFGAKASPSVEQAATPESAAHLVETFDDPLVPWAADRAPVIRQAFGFEHDEGVLERLRQAAQGGCAAELADAALRLLFPEDAPPLAKSLRARPNAHALRLLKAGQNIERGMRIAEDAPETAALLHALYRTEINSVNWQRRFRAGVLACADLSPPPIWANARI